jgi:hypothetical protein
MVISSSVTEVKVPQITLPQFSEDIFARFDLYSLFVQKLTVSKQWKEDETTFPSFQFCSWPTLALRAQRTPLLPNLLELRLFGRFKSDDEIVLWLSALISPSLHIFEVRTVTSPKAISLPNTLAILALLARRCPQLRRLGHKFSMVSASGLQNTLEQTAMPQMVLFPMICSHLESFQQLHHLIIRGRFINPESFVALSRLPNLGALEIEQIVSRSESFSNTLRATQLPDESFPALVALRLHSSALGDFLAVWDVVPLVRRLTMIYLRYEPSEDEEFASIFEEPVTRRLLPFISKRSPHIWSIQMEGTPTHEPLSMDPMSSAWAHMARLPLSYLVLRNFEADELFMKGVSSIWPGLTKLKIPDQHLSLRHLTHLSRLPKLHILRASFEDFVGPIPELEPHPGCPLHTIEITKLLVVRFEITHAEKVARSVQTAHQPRSSLIFILDFMACFDASGSCCRSGPIYSE